MTSISELSQDLVVEILSRVQITSLRAVRSTCKLWNTLSKDPGFKTKHCDKAAKDNLVIMMYDYKVCLMSINLHRKHNHKDLVDPFIKQIGDLNPVKIYGLFQCNGLLLCSTCENDHSRLVIWNPYTDQTRWIQPRKDYFSLVYAMGYDNNNNIKILRVFYCFGHFGYEIYDLKSNSWRFLRVNMDAFIHGQGVLLKGNNYFIGEERWEVRKREVQDCLLCFDYTREIFRCLPLPCHRPIEDSVILSAVSEEKLAVLSWKLDALEMEIWITDTIEPNAVSWSTFFKVNVMTPSARFKLHGNFFVDEKKKLVLICDKDIRTRTNNKTCMVGEDGYYREVDLGESKRYLVMSSYVPSSVQIQ